MSLEKAINEKDNGVQIKFLVTAGAKQTKILGYDPWHQAIKVTLSAPAQRGQANKELVDFLAKVFSLPKNSITIISGVKSTKKLVEITGIGKEKIQQSLI